MKHSFILAILITLGTAVSGLSQSPRFTSITTGPEGSISLTLTGAVLTTYTILATSDLGRPFSTVGVLVTDQNGTGSFTDPATMVLNHQRFYRAQQTLLSASRPKAPANSTTQPATTSQNQKKTQTAGASPLAPHGTR